MIGPPAHPAGHESADGARLGRTPPCRATRRHPATLRSSWSTLRIRPARLIIPITAALAALYLTFRYAFPGPGEVPILDLVALEDPLAYRVLRTWYYAAPACATLSLGCVIVRHPTSLRRAAGRAAALAVEHFASAAETANRLRSWRLVIAIFLASIALAWSFVTRPFPAPEPVGTPRGQGGAFFSPHDGSAQPPRHRMGERWSLSGGTRPDRYGTRTSKFRWRGGPELSSRPCSSSMNSIPAHRLALHRPSGLC